MPVFFWVIKPNSEGRWERIVAYGEMDYLNDNKNDKNDKDNVKNGSKNIYNINNSFKNDSNNVQDISKTNNDTKNENESPYENIKKLLLNFFSSVKSTLDDKGYVHFVDVPSIDEIEYNACTDVSDIIIYDMLKSNNKDYGIRIYPEKSVKITETVIEPTTLEKIKYSGCVNIIYRDLKKFLEKYDIELCMSSLRKK